MIIGENTVLDVKINDVAFDAAYLGSDLLFTKEVSKTAQSQETTLSLDGNVQGHEIAGDTVWATDSGKLYKIDRSDWSVVESETIANLTPGFSPTSLGDVTFYEDSLYIACGNYSLGGGAFVIKANPTTLAYEDHFDLSEDCEMGLNMVVRKGDYWYIGETARGDTNARPAIRVFNNEWSFVKNAWVSTSATTGENRVDFQGGAFVGEVLVAGNHIGSISIFRLDTDQTLIRQSDIELTDVSDTQGVSSEQNTVFVSHRDSGSKLENVVLLVYPISY